MLVNALIFNDKNLLFFLNDVYKTLIMITIMVIRLKRLNYLFFR